MGGRDDDHYNNKIYHEDDHNNDHWRSGFNGFVLRTMWSISGGGNDDDHNEDKDDDDDNNSSNDSQLMRYPDEYFGYLVYFNFYSWDVL